MRWAVSKEQKLVSFLQGKLGNYSGKSLRKALEANCCRINGRIERFGSRSLMAGETVEMSPEWKAVLEEKPTCFETIFEDDDLLVVNKPAGWICDEGAAKRLFGKQCFLVHRLDKGTTGLLIIAKSHQVKEEFIALFEKKLVQKTYLAIVDGRAKDGMKKTLLAKRHSFQGQTVWGSSSRGLFAETHWTVLAKTDEASLVECRPITGRTHQIRVHMAEAGHPILLDRQYGALFRCKRFYSRVLLHANRLQFCFRGRQMDVKAPLFQDMQDALIELCLTSSL